MFYLVIIMLIHLNSNLILCRVEILTIINTFMSWILVMRRAYLYTS